MGWRSQVDAKSPKTIGTPVSSASVPRRFRKSAFASGDLYGAFGGELEDGVGLASDDLD